MIGSSFRIHAVASIAAVAFGALVVTAATQLTAAAATAAPAAAGRSAAAPPARFHAQLTKAMPGVNDTVATSPDSIKLWFSEKVELALTKVVVSGGGAAIPLGKPAFDGPAGDAPVVLAVRDKLAPGKYAVDWTVAGKDGHPVKGTYGFVVKAAR